MVNRIQEIMKLYDEIYPIVYNTPELWASEAQTYLNNINPSQLDDAKNVEHIRNNLASLNRLLDYTDLSSETRRNLASLVKQYYSLIE
jgi:hypothetical protein